MSDATLERVPFKPHPQDVGEEVVLECVVCVVCMCVCGVCVWCVWCVCGVCVCVFVYAVM